MNCYLISPECFNFSKVLLHFQKHLIGVLTAESRKLWVGDDKEQVVGGGEDEVCAEDNQ